MYGRLKMQIVLEYVRRIHGHVLCTIYVCLRSVNHHRLLFPLFFFSFIVVFPICLVCRSAKSSKARLQNESLVILLASSFAIFACVSRKWLVVEYRDTDLPSGSLRARDLRLLRFTILRNPHTPVIGKSTRIAARSDNRWIYRNVAPRAAAETIFVCWISRYTGVEYQKAEKRL